MTYTVFGGTLNLAQFNSILCDIFVAGPVNRVLHIRTAW